MRVLVIGGTGFIGSHLVSELVGQGHEVAVFHRGSTGNAPSPAREIFGNRHDLPQHRDEFQRFAPDTVIDCILSNGQQAEALMRIFSGITGRIVALSSQDVYRACGVLHGIEPGPLEPLPLTEDSALRTQRAVYPPAALKMLRGVFAWLDDSYDKIGVEQTVQADPMLPGTVLRLPMVYGPGDPLHRLFPILKKIEDGRPAILIEKTAAQWRGPRGYVEGVAHAIALAATSPQAAGRVYNIAEQDAVTELEWTVRIAKAAGWHGRIVTVPSENAPAHLRPPGNYAQHWVCSSARIREELGFRENVPPQLALDRTIAWERGNPPRQFDAGQFDYASEDALLNDPDAYTDVLEI